MARKSDSKIYLIGILGVVTLGLITYWIYSDSKKAVRMSMEKKSKEQAGSISQSSVEPGKAKINSVIREILKDPLQLKVSVKPSQVNVPLSTIPAPEIPSGKSKEDFYHDAK